MKETIERKLQKDKGITLIALVVTVVVMLILAGISLNLVLGPNGIVQKAKDAKEMTAIGREKEEIAIAYNGAKIVKEGGEVLAGDLNDQFVMNKTNAIASGRNPIEIEFTESGRTYEIDEQGNIGGSQEDYTVTATMTRLYNYYVGGDTTNGYQLKSNGTDCISIESKEEMKYLAEYTNSGYITKDVKFVLLNDIDLNPGITINREGTVTGGTPEQWIPIGKMEEIAITSQAELDEKINEYGAVYNKNGWSIVRYNSMTKPYFYAKEAFKGKFNGQDYTIKGMYINDNTMTGNGLFGVADGTKIDNLTISNSYLYAGNLTGVFVGMTVVNGITIKNSKSIDNYIYGNNIGLGGFIGGVGDGNTYLNNLYSNNYMDFAKEDYASDYIGGVGGIINGNTCDIYKCVNETDMFNRNVNPEEEIYNKDDIGGIVGWLETNSSNIKDCVNKGRIEGSWDGTGGIIGMAQGTEMTISNCKNFGMLEGSWSVGGILGWAVPDYLNIYNCYNTGKLCNNYPDGGNLGGIIGQSRATMTMYNCYNLGDIEATIDNYSYGDIGGIIGQNNEGKIYNCYSSCKIDVYVKTKNVADDGFGGIFGSVGSTFGDTQISNCFQTNEVIIKSPDDEVGRVRHYGEVAGNIMGEITIENCYGYSNKILELAEGACNMAQNVGTVKPTDSWTNEFTGTRILKGYYNPNDSTPSVATNADKVTQELTEVTNYKSQEFCDKLNEWVENNNPEGKYSRWKYDANKNNGLPYLEDVQL